MTRGIAAPKPENPLTFDALRHALTLVIRDPEKTIDLKIVGLHFRLRPHRLKMGGKRLCDFVARFLVALSRRVDMNDNVVMLTHFDESIRLGVEVTQDFGNGSEDGVHTLWMPCDVLGQAPSLVAVLTLPVLDTRAVARTRAYPLRRIAL